MADAPKFIRDTTLSDVAKITLIGVGVFAAWKVSSAISEGINFLIGKKPEIPFNPNDVLYVRMKANGRFPRDKKDAYENWKDVVLRLYSNNFKERIPYTNFFVAKRVGGESFDYRCSVPDEKYFCDEVLITIPLEFPQGDGASRKRKEALLKLSLLRAQDAFGTQMSKILVGLQSLGGVPDFDIGSEDKQLAALESMFSGYTGL
jgi:hypothetical protein